MSHRPNPPRYAVPDATLQRYHDGEASADEQAALTPMLMRDAAVRRRLDHLRRIDEVARAALRCEPGESRRSAPSRHIAWLAAACVVIAGAAAAIFVTGPDGDAAVPHRAERTTPIADAPYSRTRLLVSLPAAHPPAPPAAAPAPAPAEKGGGEADLARAVAVSLAAGRVDDALTDLARLPVAEHGALWARLAVFMRSSELARESMLLLPVDQQIEIVRVWSGEPMLRPVVFERLKELMHDPDAASAARALHADLARDPAMRSWISSYAAR